MPPSLLAVSVEVFAEHGLLDVAEFGLQRVTPGIAEQGRGLVARHQVAPGFGNRRDGAVAIEHAGRRLHAGRCKQPVLVVLQKHPPSISVTGDELQDCLPGIGLVFNTVLLRRLDHLIKLFSRN